MVVSRIQYERELRNKENPGVFTICAIFPPFFSMLDSWYIHQVQINEEFHFCNKSSLYPFLYQWSVLPVFLFVHRFCGVHPHQSRCLLCPTHYGGYVGNHLVWSDARQAAPWLREERVCRHNRGNRMVSFHPKWTTFSTSSSDNSSCLWLCYVCK